MHFEYSRGVAFRPTTEAPFGKTFLSEPESLTVIDEHFDRSRAAAAKYKQAIGERIGREFLLAQRYQPINALAEVDRVDGDQNAHLRRDLDHACRQARSN